MTDIDTFRDLLDQWGVAYELESGDSYTSVVLRAKTQGVEGYLGFIFQADFSDEGTFLSFGLWE